MSVTPYALSPGDLKVAWRAELSLLHPLAIALALVATAANPAEAESKGFFAQHCYECHGADSPEAGLDLSALKFKPSDAENFQSWQKVYNRLESGEMPPPDQPRPLPEELATVLSRLHDGLVAAEAAKLAGEGRRGLRH